MAQPTANPRTRHPNRGFPEQKQEQPGLTRAMRPRPDHGEQSYAGSNRLAGQRALITGGDSGIGRAVAIAFAREGADVAISYLPEELEDAAETIGWVERAGRTAVGLAGDIRGEEVNEAIVAATAERLGGLEILVLNAGYQRNRDGLEALTTAEFSRTMETNLYAQIWMTRAALPYLQPGASIIVTTSIQGFNPSPKLIDYAMTKAAQVAFVKALAQELGERGIRVNGVAPGPIWTPLIPATDWAESLPDFGQDTPLGRAGQPAELASTYVFLASPESSYISGAIVPVTGGKGL